MKEKIKELIEFYEGLIGQSQLMLHNNTSNDNKIRLESAINSLQFVIADLTKILN